MHVLRAFPLGIENRQITSLVVRRWSLATPVNLAPVDFANDQQPTTNDGSGYSYPIDPLGYLHGFDNKRVKIAIERVKLAVGGAK
jgi:hypothetical protein